jgi:hypothetical protein
MKLILACLFLGSCSPRPVDHNNSLPRYSDMSAAADAGAVSSGNVK